MFPELDNKIIPILLGCDALSVERGEAAILYWKFEQRTPLISVNLYIYIYVYVYVEIFNWK